MLAKAIGILFLPGKTWQSVAQLSDAQLKPYLLYPAVLALIPAYAWYYGTTQVGWTVAGGQPTRFTPDSAMMIAILFYLAQLIAIWVVGYFVHWMSDTYGAESSAIKGMAVTGLCATPILLSGLLGFHPLFWLDFVVGLAAVSYGVYLLYIGIPIVMRIPEERGFLFASAIVAVGLVMAVVVMGATVILWDMGYAPAFTD